MHVLLVLALIIGIIVGIYLTVGVLVGHAAAITSLLNAPSPYRTNQEGSHELLKVLGVLLVAWPIIFTLD